MTTQNTPIDLAGSGVYTNSTYTTVVTTGAAAYNSGYTGGITQTLTNSGTLYSTGTTGGHADAGVEITVDGAVGQNNSITNNGGGLITGYSYGIYLGGGHSSSPVIISNAGSIIARSTAQGNSSGIFAGNGATVSVTNSGVIAGSTGVFLQTDDVGVQVVNNLAGGTITGATSENGYNYAIKIQDITSGLVGTGNIYNAGLINGFIDDAARYGNLTNASTGTITEGLLVFGTGTLTLEAGGSVGGRVRFADGRYSGASLSLATLVLGGAAGTIGSVADPGNFTGFGTITVAAGADWTLGTSSSSAGFAAVSTIDNFGTVNLAGPLTGNTIDMEGSVAGTATKVEFTGADTSTPIVDFGANDQIVLDNGIGATSYTDTFSNGVLTVTAYNGNTAFGSDEITVSAAPGTTLAPNGSFIEISGPGGPTIVLGSSSLGSAGSIYIDNGNSVTLSNTSAVDTVPVTFGPDGTLGAFNTLDVNGSVAGTSSPYAGPITGFGLNDDILIGPSTIPGDTTIGASIGASIALSYAGTLLTVTELSASGATLGATSLDVGVGYAANSFVALLGTNGINIETPQTVEEQSFTLTGNGAGTEDFTDPTAYAGSLSPGDSIVTGETVTVASNPAVQVAIENPETNSGTILIDGSQVIDAASATGGSDLTGSGTVAIENGGFFQQNGGSTSNTIAFGANTTSVISELSLNDSVSSFASPILGFGTNDEIFLASNVLPAPATGSSLSDTYDPTTGTLVITETNAAGAVVGTETLDVASGGTLTADSFVLVSGPTGVRVFTDDTQLSTTNGNLLANTSGSIVIDHGQQVTLANTLGVDNLPVIFGPNGTSLALNVLDLNGTVTGTNSPYQGSISGFGLNDDIILSSSVLPSQVLGGFDSLSYAGSLLSVTEFDASGNSIGSTTLDVGTGYAANSFVALLGSNGVNIETPATVDEQPLTFNASGTANFETTTDYSGGLAPGSSIVGGETVIIASGTAAVSTTAPISNSGTIIVSGASSGFVDAGTLSGNGTIIATEGASVSLATATGTVDFVNDPSGPLNTLYLDGSPTGFAGTIGRFGINDDIVLGSSVLPSVGTGDSVTLSYAGSLLTVTELDSSGASIGSTTLDVGTGYAADSFVALLGTNGVNIETAQTVEDQSFVLSANGANFPLANFEDPTQYQGGLAPGATIVAGETVTVVPTSLADLTSSLTNDGVILLDGTDANMETSDPLSGTGTVSLTGGAELVLGNAAGVTTDTIAFGAGGNVLALDGTGTASFAGTITGISGSDAIDLGGSFLPTPGSASAITLNYNSMTGVLTVSDTVGGTVYTDSLNIAGPVPGTFSAAVSGGNIVITDIPCFAAGTRILTPQGERRVEDLAIGDEVITVRDNAVQQIIWVGSRTVDISRHANPDKIVPVLIKAGAFGAGLPERDLRVSPDHALFIDGALIEAKTLVNGATIIRDRAQKFVTYHHIELERHDVVLAEGLPAETYLDSGNRQNFESDAGPIALHPDFVALSRAAACATLLLDGEIVRRARQGLLERAVSLGFTRTDAIDLVAKANSEVIAPHTDETGRQLLFVLPAEARQVTLASATGVPADIQADPSDRRVLGVSITGMVLIAGHERIDIDLYGPHRGFHDAEPGQRWTDGNATIALPAYSGRAVLEVTLAGQATRWQAPAAVRQFISG